MFDIEEVAKKKLMKQQLADYMSIAIPDLDMAAFLSNEPIVTSSHQQKTKIALDIPAIDLNATPPKSEGKTPSIAPINKQTPAPSNNTNSTPPHPNNMGGAPTPNTPPTPTPGIDQKPSIPPELEERLKAVEGKVSEIYKIIDSMVNISELNIFKESIIKEMLSVTKDINKKFEEFKKHTVPERVNFDSEIIYKDRVFGKLCTILDEILIPLFDQIPNYNLIGMANSKYYDDGAVCNALVTIGIEVNKDDFKYNFKTDIPILNGVVQAPTFISKANKLIPLVKTEIQKELTNGYMKSTAETAAYESKKMNLFTPVFEQYIENTDTQKEYMSSNPLPATGIPDDKWKGNMNSRKTLDGVGNFSVNNPKYGPKF